MSFQASLRLLYLLPVLACGQATVTRNIDGPSVVELFYSVDNDLDGDFIISQLHSEQNRNDLEISIWPYGGLQIIADGNGAFYCHGKNFTCETSFIHYCIKEIGGDYALLSFLECYFQSEHWPVDLIGSSQQCATEEVWNAATSCFKSKTVFDTFAQDVRQSTEFRPIFDATPRVFLNGHFSALAAIDLPKSLCQVNATDMWQCESMSQFKEPKCQIFYSPGDQKTAHFFFTQLNRTVAQYVRETTARLDFIPNPNQVAACSQNTTTAACWNNRLHWCIYSHLGGLRQLEIIQCTLEMVDSTAAIEEVLQKCAKNESREIENCISALFNSTTLPTRITQLQRWLNQRVEPFQQEPVEVIINGLSNVKAKEGLLQEICYNFLHVDNETLGCRVIRPHVTVFYEATSELFNAKFAHFRNFGRLAPFESIAQFEFIPYPRNATNLGGNNTCPLEDDHCMANWIHGCLVKMHYDNVQDQFLFMQFFMCTSSAQEKSPLDQARECVHQVYDGYGPNFWESIVDCAQNDSNLKEEFRKKSEAIKLQEMPEIVIDGQVKTHEVGDHLLGYLCNSFHQIRPRACFEIDDHSVATVTLTVFLSGDSSSQDFVLSQMKPLLVSEPRDPSLRLRDVINWHFVPWGPSLFNEDGGSIKCRNGVNECLVNRILTCASVNFRENDQLGIRNNRLRVASFVVCLFDSALWQTSPLEAANQCSNILSPNVDTYPQLWQCTIQESKKQMMIEMKQLTENNYPPLDTFPVVAINTQRPQLITNLVQVLCSHFKEEITPMPVECTVPVETTDTPTTKPPSGGTAKENPLWLLWAITAAIMLCS